MIKTQTSITTIALATLLNAIFISAQVEEKKSEELQYKNLSKEIRKIASNIEQMVHYHNNKIKSKERKQRQDVTLTHIKEIVARLQGITLTAVNKLKSQRRIVTTDPISSKDQNYKTLARSVRKIASNVDTIVSDDTTTSDKTVATPSNNALRKIATLTKQLNQITAPMIQKINNSNTCSASDLLEAGTWDAGIDLEKEGTQHAKDCHQAISQNLQRGSTW